MALDAYGPESEGRRGKADSRSHREPGAVKLVTPAGRAHLANGHIIAAQEVLTSLERGEIGRELAMRHLRRHLEEAKRLLGGEAPPALAGDP